MWLVENMGAVCYTWIFRFSGEGAMGTGVMFTGIISTDKMRHGLVSHTVTLSPPALDFARANPISQTAL